MDNPLVAARAPRAAEVRHADNASKWIAFGDWLIAGGKGCCRQVSQAAPASWFPQSRLLSRQELARDYSEMRRHPPRIRNQPPRVGCAFGVSGATVRCITALVSCLPVTSSESPLPLPTTANFATLKSSRSSRRCYRLYSPPPPNAAGRETVFLWFP